MGIKPRDIANAIVEHDAAMTDADLHAAVREHADRIERMLERACETADVPYHLVTFAFEWGRPIRFTVRATLTTAQFHALRDAIAEAVPIDPVYGVTRFEIEAGGG